MTPYIITVEGKAVGIAVTCRVCSTEHRFILDKEQYFNWQAGMVIQQAFPEMDPDIRELLISSICGTCFDNMFKDEDA